MIRNIVIKNYKSVSDVKLSLGRMNVFIGENGAGKSNILEAIALAGAASAAKLDNEFLTSRGIRVASPHFMRSAFPDSSKNDPIIITVSDGKHQPISYEIMNEDGPYSNWKCNVNAAPHTEGGAKEGALNITYREIMDLLKRAVNDDRFDKNELVDALSSLLDNLNKAFLEADARKSAKKSRNKPVKIHFDKIIAQIMLEYSETVSPYRSGHCLELSDFIVYSPENTAMRIYEREGQIEPLGINGEGLFKLLSVLAQTNNGEKVAKINSKLKLFGWFQDLTVTPESSAGPGAVAIVDRFLPPALNGFDFRSVNEGFLFVLFYFLLFSSDLTPKFFAIDNIDASLNPKLCQKLIKELAALSADFDKQVLMTTHNPAVLDGLNLSDPEQRLFVVSRNSDGQTRVRRIEDKPKAVGTAPVRLSEAFLRGSLGGLPRSF